MEALRVIATIVLIVAGIILIAQADVRRPNKKLLIAAALTFISVLILALTLLIK